MTLLVDTHIALWAAVADLRLKGPLKQAYEEPTHQLVLSVASLWEVSIKVSIGRLPLPVTPADFFAREVATRGYRILDIQRGHAERVATLPFPEGHRDPFDRMLVAQALVEGLPLLTADPLLDSYRDAGLVLAVP